MDFTCADFAEVSESRVRKMVSRFMALRGFDLDEIKTMSIEAETFDGSFTTVISALVMW